MNQAGNRSLRAASDGSDKDDDEKTIQVDAGDTGELSCHLFRLHDQTDYYGNERSHANLSRSSSYSAQQNLVSTQQNAVDKLLESLGDSSEKRAGDDDDDDVDDDAYHLLPAKSSSGRPINDGEDDWLVSLVFWYKDDNPSPIYTLDARHQMLSATIPTTTNPINRMVPSLKSSSTSTQVEGPTEGEKTTPLKHLLMDEKELRLVNLLARARHYSANEQKYKLDTSKISELKLLITNTNANDSGEYKCRIDFRRWPTQNKMMKLSVKVPVSRPEIIVVQSKKKEGGGEEGGSTGKQLLSSSSSLSLSSSSQLELEEEQEEEVEFTCLVRQGSPKPKLSWILERRPPSSQRNNSNNDSNSISNGGINTTTEVKELIGQETDQSSFGAADSTFAVAAISKLRLVRFGRDWQNSRLGCRAIQPQTIRTASDKSQSTNLTSVGREKLLNANDKMIDDDSGLSNNNNNNNNSLIGSVQVSDDQKQQKHNEPLLDGRQVNQQKRQQQQQQQTEWIQLRLRLRPTKIEIVWSEQMLKKLQTRQQQQNKTQRGSRKLKLDKKKADGEQLWVAEFDELSEKQDDHDDDELQFNHLFSCRSEGSWPPAKLFWSLVPSSESESESESDSSSYVSIDNDLVYQQRHSSSEGSSSSRSQLKLIGAADGNGERRQLIKIDRRLNGLEFVCLASNEHLMSPNNLNSTLKAKLKILVNYKPSVNLVREEPKKGDEKEVKLRCIFQSNPPINQLVWLVNEQPLAKIMPSQLISTPTNLLPVAIINNDNREDSAQSLRSSVHQRHLFENWRVVADSSSSADGSRSRGELNQNGKQYRLEGPDKLVLVAAGRRKNDNNEEDEPSSTETTISKELDSYKCLAINNMGQQESEPLRLQHNYRPVCLSALSSTVNSVAAAVDTVDSGDILKAIQQQIHDSSSNMRRDDHNDDAHETIQISCPVESQPSPDKIHWSFISFKELAQFVNSFAQSVNDQQHKQQHKQSINDLIRELNQSARWHLETNKLQESRGQLKSNYLPAENKEQAGILLCRAENPLGWQRVPCLIPLNLDEKSGELLLKRAPADCSFEARTNYNIHLHQHHLHHQQTQQQQQPWIWVEINCDNFNKQTDAEVLFQLDISNKLETKRVWFSSKSLPHQITNLPSLNNNNNSNNNINNNNNNNNNNNSNKTEGAYEGTTATKNNIEPTVITLDKLKLDLLDNLEFTLWATDLISTSKPRSIYGRDLQLTSSSNIDDSEDGQEVAHSGSVQRPYQQKQQHQQNQPQQQQQVVQVLRSATTSELLLDSTNSDTSSAAGGAGGATSSVGQLHHHNNQFMQKARTAGKNNQDITQQLQSGGGSPISSSKEGHEYEINIAIAAIAGTCVLSLLTLTLIVMLLMRHRQQHSTSALTCSASTANESASPAAYSNCWPTSNERKKVQGNSNIDSQLSIGNGKKLSPLWRRILPSNGNESTTTTTSTVAGATTTTTTNTTAAGSDTVDSQLELELRPASSVASCSDHQHHHHHHHQQPSQVARFIICEPDDSGGEVTSTLRGSLNYLAPAKVRTANFDWRSQENQTKFDCSPRERVHLSKHNSSTTATDTTDENEDDIQDDGAANHRSSHLSLIEIGHATFSHQFELPSIGHMTNEQLYMIEREADEKQQQREQRQIQAFQDHETASRGQSLISERSLTCQLHHHNNKFSSLNHHPNHYHVNQLHQQQQQQQHATHRRCSTTNANNAGSGSCCCSPAATCSGSSSLHYDELINSSSLAATTSQLSNNNNNNSQSNHCSIHLDRLADSSLKATPQQAFDCSSNSAFAIVDQNNELPEVATTSKLTTTAAAVKIRNGQQQKLGDSLYLFSFL